jgi:hypothetical protein
MVWREGCAVSVSTVGCTLTRLRAWGHSVEPALVRGGRWRWRRGPRAAVGPAAPVGYTPQRHGDLIEIDTTAVARLAADSLYRAGCGLPQGCAVRLPLRRLRKPLNARGLVIRLRTQGKRMAMKIWQTTTRGG